MNAALPITMLGFLLLAVGARADVVSAGPIAYGFWAGGGASCDVTHAEAEAQTVSAEITDASGAVRATLAPVLLAPGAVATLTIPRWSLTGGTRLACTAVGDGSLQVTLSTRDYDGSSRETASAGGS